MLIHQKLEISGMEYYCSAGWPDRPHFKGQFEVERLVKSRWETFWEISRQRFSISVWLTAHLWLHLAIVSVVFLNMAPSVNSLETSGGETTEVRKDGSLGKDSQTGPVSGSSLLHPQESNFGFCSCSPVQWQNKGSTVQPAAQDVGTELALVLLVQRDLHTSIYRSWLKSQLITRDITSGLSQGNYLPILHSLAAFDNELNLRQAPGRLMQQNE